MPKWRYISKVIIQELTKLNMPTGILTRDGVTEDDKKSEQVHKGGRS